MPYSLTNQPSAIKELPTQAKRVWIAAFNSSLKQYNNEQKAFQIAWSAIEKAGWKKDNSGKWVRWK